MSHALRCYRKSPQLNFIALSLRGKRIGFETELKEDQDDTDVKKEYCAAEFDKSDDKETLPISPSSS